MENVKQKGGQARIKGAKGPRASKEFWLPSVPCFQSAKFEITNIISQQAKAGGTFLNAEDDKSFLWEKLKSVVPFKFALKANPQTRNPKPEALNPPKPETLNPKPQTLNAKPLTPNAKP